MQIKRREFIRTAGLGVAVMAGGAWADKLATTRPTDPYFFIQMADPQLYWGSVKSWKRAIACANALKPEFVVVCGDLLNCHGSLAKRDWKKDEQRAKDYLDATAGLDKNIPIHNLAGNHDVCNTPTPKTLEWYVKRFGKLWYTFSHAGDFFMAIESDLIKNPAGAPKVAREQMDWIAKTLLSKAVKKARHRIVFMHHPMCLKKHDERSQYFNLPLEPRTQLLKLFARAGVRAVFSGHYHGNLYAKFGDIELVTTSSTGKALRKDPLGFRIVKVYPDRIEHKYYGYETLPKNVGF
ncbi:MAG: metallophosphoesterase [Phycisphaerae bacterium]|jgi:predicted MPP superfamily phosphohydrolase|nr:metallophosphoesterase [Phycisphaerae bacterium]